MAFHRRIGRFTCRLMHRATDARFGGIWRSNSESKPKASYPLTEPQKHCGPRKDLGTDHERLNHLGLPWNQNMY